MHAHCWALMLEHSTVSNGRARWMESRVGCKESYRLRQCEGFWFLLGRQWKTLRVLSRGIWLGQWATKESSLI